MIKARDSLSMKEQKKLINDLDAIKNNNPEKSLNIRRNLILNGLDYIRNRPVFGLGAGGYEIKCQKEENKFYVAKQISPHNLPIELISKFGVFGWGYFAFLIILLCKVFKLKQEILPLERMILVLILFSIPLLWLMPSAYLLLDTHKLLTPIFLVYYLIIKEKNKKKALN